MLISESSYCTAIQLDEQAMFIVGGQTARVPTRKVVRDPSQWTTDEHDCDGFLKSFR